MGSKDRRPYLTATTLDQTLLDEMADNLDGAIRTVVTVETPAGDLRTSDRHTYVGSSFYRAGCTIPLIKRTIGEWLSPTIEFSTLELPVSNVDGRFNNLLPGGADFDGWIGKEVDVKVGIRDASATYFTIYRGKVTDVGGLGRDRQVIKIRSRDALDSLNQKFPKTFIDGAVWTEAEDAIVNATLPVIYGDWTVSPLQEIPDPGGGAAIMTASIPTFVVNGKNSSVLNGTANVRALVSENDNLLFDDANVWVRRGDTWGIIPTINITAVTDGRDFEVVPGFTFDGAPYVYQPGDSILVRVKGKDLGAYSDNIVWQARDILIEEGGAVSGDFDATWATYRDKATPAVSAVANIPARVWRQDQESAVTVAISLLEQVRLEMFINRDLKLSISSLHLEDFDATPSFSVRQWDLIDASLTPQLDDRNVWNRARGQYAFDPVSKQQSRQTATYRNQAAITQAGKAIAKELIFPNLYVEADVVNQTKESLRLASGYPEFVELKLTPRALLQDVGGFVSLNVAMGSTVFSGVPAMIREIGIEPSGALTAKLWSFQMTPFSGWDPDGEGYGGVVGGSTATISKE